MILLAPTDYEITESESGEEALAVIAKQRPDLILMDSHVDTGASAFIVGDPHRRIIREAVRTGGRGFTPDEQVIC